MKKIYAFLAASLAVGTMAATPVPKKTPVLAKFDVTKAALVEKAHQEVINGIGTQEFKVKPQRAGGDQYLVRTRKNAERYIDLVNGDFEFDDAPYYWFTISFDDMNGDIAVYDYNMPCVAMLQHDDQNAADFTDWWTQTSNGYDFNWDKAAQVYGSKEKAQRAPTFEEITQIMNGYQMGIVAYGYLTVYNCWSYNPSTWADQQGYFLRAGVINAAGTDFDLTNSAKLLFGEYSAADETFTVAFDAPMGTVVDDGAGGQVFGQLVGTLSSLEGFTTTPILTGWEPTEMEIGEVHLFNLGSAPDYQFSFDNDLYQLGGSQAGCLYENYEPSQLYYMAFCGPELTFEPKIEEATLPSVPSAYEQPTIDQINWFRGYITLEPNNDPANVNPKGEAKLDITNYMGDRDGYLVNSLRPGMWFGAYYLRNCPDSQPLAGSLGSVGEFLGEFSIPNCTQNFKTGEVTKPSVIGIGDAEKGFYGDIITDAGTNVVFNHKGMIYYHYDSEDYTAYKEIAATGGVQGVGVEAETVATDYYNFQGIRMNNAPEQGIYIVREHKADGTVVSHKVVK